MAESRRVMNATAASVDDLEGRSGKALPAGLEDFAPRRDPHADETKWPAWKVTIALIVFCGAFWTGMILLGLRLIALFS